MDLEWLGLLFASLVIRDLRVLAQALDGEMFHYSDEYGAFASRSIPAAAANPPS